MMHLGLKGGTGQGAYVVQDFITILCQHTLLFPLLIITIQGFIVMCLKPKLNGQFYAEMTSKIVLSAKCNFNF